MTRYQLEMRPCGLLLFSVSFNVLAQVGEQVQLCRSRY